ncbi:hypothetical protein Dalk_3788 [Desulfatibacillum aliphaticivorans]|uniref:Uncharacterized protein n=1 Tax=Desulfatibacillum aliphaticivorans TaxID=218208 RepID=B8FC56_DESAL|nr:hypothetical protein Dalk_3788 [Desulfatibacillum aliphaticivorans]
MFDLSKCDVCGTRLDERQLLDFNRESASKLPHTGIDRRGGPWISQGIRGFARHEYCEKGARPCEPRPCASRHPPKNDPLLEDIFIRPRRLPALSPECKEAGLTPYFNTGLRLMAPGDLINFDLKGILP